MLATTHTIGETLRARREGLGLSVGDVADQLLFREDFVRAIELGDEDGLPAIGYAVGYVRAYAELVNLDAAAAVGRWKSERGIGAQMAVRETPHIVDRRPLRVPRLAVTAALILLGLAALGLWLGRGPAPDVVAVATPAPHTATPAPTDVITFTFTSASWAEIRTPEGQVLKSRIFAPGETLSVPRALDPVLAVRDAGAVTVALDGVDYGPLGAPGEIAEAVSATAVIAAQLPPELPAVADPS